MVFIANILLVGSFLLGALALLLALLNWRPVHSDAEYMGQGIIDIFLIILTVVGMACAAGAFFVCESGQAFALAALTIHALCLAIVLGRDTFDKWREERAKRKITVLLEQASTELQERRWDQAVSSLTKVIGLGALKPGAPPLYPGTIEAYYRRATAYVALNELDRAIADCNQIIATDPSPITHWQPTPPFIAEAYVLRGTAFARTGQHDKAIADFTDAISLTPELATPYQLRAQSRRAIGDTEGAVEDERRKDEILAERDKRLIPDS